MKTLTYTPELFADIVDNQIDWYQTGETVCGAEDPAVVYIGTAFGAKHPELAGYSVVRVIDRYANPWKSDTLLEFSNRDATDDELERHEDYSE